MGSVKNGAYFVAYGLLATGIGLTIFLLYTTNYYQLEAHYVLFSCVLAAILINTASTITLIIGLHKENRTCVWAFLIIQSSLYAACSMGAMTIFAMSEHFNYHMLYLILAAVGTLVAVAKYYVEMLKTDNHYTRQTNESS